MSNQLSSITNIVVLMMENRSFDHMLGFLYPAGPNFEGLTGNESNPTGVPAAPTATVFKISPTDPNISAYPGVDPAEGFISTNFQLFCTKNAPTPPLATNQGFVTSWNQDIQPSPGWPASPDWVMNAPIPTIMGMFTPDTLPILSALAKGYAVCDQWFGSVPTETLPNRAFLHSATSQGIVTDSRPKPDNKTPIVFTSPTIFTSLTNKGITWGVYGYDLPSLTRNTFSDLVNADDSHFGLFTDFKAKVSIPFGQPGALESYVFLEPSWNATANSQHPIDSDIAAGEQLIYDVYETLRNGPNWNNTLLIITYDEHGGCFDHVPPPYNAVPDGVPPQSWVPTPVFDFGRFGPRVPTVLISPRIEPGTIFRVPVGGTPLDHTSILKTVETRWGLSPLTARDAAALDIGDALTLSTNLNTTDYLKGLAPNSALNSERIASNGTKPPMHLLQVLGELVSQLPEPAGIITSFPTKPNTLEMADYIKAKVASWHQYKADLT